MKKKLLIIVIAETILLVCMVLFLLIKKAEAEQYSAEVVQLREQVEEQRAIAIRKQGLCQEKQGQLEVALHEANEARTKLAAYLANQSRQ